MVGYLILLQERQHVMYYEHLKSALYLGFELYLMILKIKYLQDIYLAMPRVTEPLAGYLPREATNLTLGESPKFNYIFGIYFYNRLKLNETIFKHK